MPELLLLLLQQAEEKGDYSVVFFFFFCQEFCGPNCGEPFPGTDYSPVELEKEEKNFELCILSSVSGFLA